MGLGDGEDELLRHAVSSLRHKVVPCDVCFMFVEV